MFNHLTVLKHESIELLAIKEDGIYVDATMGGGGHSTEILKKLSTGHLYAFDQDDFAICKTPQKLAHISKNFTVIKSNFVNIKSELALCGVKQIDGIIFDLGVSSPQLDDEKRGFSYHYDAQLDMRMDKDAKLTAKEVINKWEFNELVRIFSRYGEERFSKQIARKIEAQRRVSPIESTLELVEIIKAAIPAAARRRGGHPAKRIFQAIRIAVNDELNVFEKALAYAMDMLKVNGRIAVIAFHSLEDRIVKHMFAKVSKEDDVYRGMPVVPVKYLPEFEIITKKPVTPSESELKINRRSRSAKLRVIQRTRIRYSEN